MISIEANGALAVVEGNVSLGATLSEDIYFFEDGSAVDLTGLSFEFQFRSSPYAESADFKLSTADATMSLENDTGGVKSILRLNLGAGEGPPAGTYIADLVSKDAQNRLTHYAHGVVTFQNNPIAF